MFDNLVVSFMVDEVVGGFFINVPPGHIACIFDRGRGVLQNVYDPGLHIKIPFWQVAKLFNAQILEYTIQEGFDITNREALGDTPIKSTTKDGHDITMTGSILFRINKSNAPELWENIGEHFVSKVIRPFSRSKISAILNRVTVEDVKHRRPEIEAKLKEELNAEFGHRGLICEGALLSEVKVSKSPSDSSEQVVHSG